jgi:probable HAF family extracellular repeat protein
MTALSRWPAALLAALTLLGVTVSSATAGPLYTIQNLGIPPGSSPSGFADGFGLNDRGQAAGYVNSHAGFYDGTAWTDLGGFLPDAYSIARGINNNGLLVGSGITNLGDQHAFLYDGTFHDLGTPGLPSQAFGINNQAQIVGYASFSSGSPNIHAFLYQNGTMTDLGTLGGSNSRASAINDRGQVTGSAQTATGRFHAFLYNGTTMIDLGVPVAQDGSIGRSISGNAINDKGDVAGSFTYRDASSVFHIHPFLFDGSALTDLGTLGGSFAEALGTNSAGDVVGYSFRSDGSSAAFVTKNGTMYDLSDLIPQGTGYTLLAAEAINQQGQILVDGEDADHNVRAFLLTPAHGPEPSTLTLAGIGILGLLGYGWRRARTKQGSQWMGTARRECARIRRAVT